MVTNATLFVILVTVAAVTAQTFQYSRGWTNGKRSRKEPDLATSLDRILSPCQMGKLRYVLEGKPINERLFVPCDYVEEEVEQPKRFKHEHNQDGIFDTFQ